MKGREGEKGGIERGKEGGEGVGKGGRKEIPVEKGGREGGRIK